MTKSKQRQPKSDNPLNDPRRLYTRSFKASWWQIQEIERLAEACGENVSTYVLMRALGYQPKARLTDEERQGLTNLRDCRRDVRKYFNALEGYSREERQVFFRRHAFMVEWVTRLMTMSDCVEDYLNRVESPNVKPQAAERSW